MIMLNIEELKDLILFCKHQKVKSLQVGNVNFEMSEYSHIEQLSEQEATPLKEETQSSKTLVDTAKPDFEGEDPDLFWSSNA